MAAIRRTTAAASSAATVAIANAARTDVLGDVGYSREGDEEPTQAGAQGNARLLASSIYDEGIVNLVGFPGDWDDR